MKLSLKILTVPALLTLMACQAKYDVDGEVVKILEENELFQGDTPALDVLTTVGDVNDESEVQTPIDQVALLCASRPLETKTLTIDFTPSGQTCDWNQNGNLEPSNFFLQARVEQKIQLDLPAGALPCNMSLSFPSQSFRYDDHFILSLNRSILASSYNFGDNLDSGTNGLLHYDWEKIVGIPWDTDQEQVYCPAIDGNKLLCDFPGHDEEGDIQIQLGPKHVLGAMSDGAKLDGQYFQMTTIGDNDPLDCEHTGMSFSVTVNYVK